jgi:hypothetical protein
LKIEAWLQGAAELRGYEDKSEEIYISSLQANRDTEDGDYVSSPDGTDIDGSSDDQDGTRTQPLVDSEMLGSP